MFPFVQVVRLGKGKDVYFAPPDGVVTAGPLQPLDAQVFQPHSPQHPAVGSRWQPSPWRGFGLKNKYDGWAHLEPTEALRYEQRHVGWGVHVYSGCYCFVPLFVARGVALNWQKCAGNVFLA